MPGGFFLVGNRFAVVIVGKRSTFHGPFHTVAAGAVAEYLCRTIRIKRKPRPSAQIGGKMTEYVMPRDRASVTERVMKLTIKSESGTAAPPDGHAQTARKLIRLRVLEHSIVVVLNDR